MGVQSQFRVKFNFRGGYCTSLRNTIRVTKLLANMTVIPSIPNEIFFKILSYLDLGDLWMSRRVCKDWNAKAMRTAWQLLYQDSECEVSLLFDNAGDVEYYSGDTLYPVIPASAPDDDFITRSEIILEWKARPHEKHYSPVICDDPPIKVHYKSGQRARYDVRRNYEDLFHLDHGSTNIFYPYTHKVARWTIERATRSENVAIAALDPNWVTITIPLWQIVMLVLKESKWKDQDREWEIGDRNTNEQASRLYYVECYCPE